MDKIKKFQKTLFTAQSPLLVTTRVKILLTVLVSLVIALLSVFLVHQQYMLSLTTRTETIATLIDSQKLESVRTNDSEASRNASLLKQQLQMARGTNTDAQYMFVMSVTPNNVPFFLVDSAPKGTNKYKPSGHDYPDASSALMAAFYSNQSTIFGPVVSTKGAALSVVSPVYDPLGKRIGLVGIEIRPETYFSVISLSIIIPLLGATLLSAMFLTSDSIRRRQYENVRMRSELVSIASHELRTPLTGIRWGEESLLKKDIGTESKQILQSMYDSTLRLQESIEDILQLANWQAGRNQDLVKTSTDITDLIEAIFATHKLPAAQKNVSLEFEHKWPRKLILNCDSQRMKRVFNNLISNAIKYSQPNTVVYVGHQKIEGRHVITIKDTGIGIPKDEQNKVFEGFYRASNASKHKANGTGMGLYMSRSAIEQHGGKLWLSSTENKGTTVYVQLP